MNIIPFLCVQWKEGCDDRLWARALEGGFKVLGSCKKEDWLYLEMICRHLLIRNAMRVFRG